MAGSSFGGTPAPNPDDERFPGWGPPANTPVLNADAFKSFQARDAQDRAAMQPTMGMLAGAAQGQGPSVAQAQGMMAEQAAQQQALGAIGAQRGGTGAGAMPAALGPGMQGMQAVNMQAAAARQHEQLQAMQQYSDALVEQRAADLKGWGMDENQAYQQAQLEVQQNDLNTQIAQAKQKNDAQIMGSIMKAIGSGFAAGV